MTLHQPEQRAFTGSSDGEVAAPARRRPARHSAKAYLYVAPAFLVFAAFLGAPVVQTVQYSFYDWDGLGRSTAAGLSNYVAVFTDERLRDSFLHAGGVLMLFYAAAPVLLGLFLSALISRAHAMRSMSFFRTVLFLPQVIATVVIATIWISIYSQDGLLNQTLRLVGLDSLSRVWLGDHTFALAAIGLVGTCSTSACALCCSCPASATSHPNSSRPRVSTEPGAQGNSSRSRCRRCAARSPSR